MQRLAVSGQDAFVHHFRQGRVREDRGHQFGLGRFQRLANDIALDQLGHFRADHVRAQQFAGLGIEHGLHKAFRFAQRDGLAIADEGEGSGLDLVTSFFRLGLGQASPTAHREAETAKAHRG